jgi:hypothetical protein
VPPASPATQTGEVGRSDSAQRRNARVYTERDVTKAAPEGLRDAGKALRTEILNDVADGWTLDARELHLLRRACRCADELVELERVVDEEGVVVRGSRGQATAHPALGEAHQLRLLQLRLLGSIELPDDEDEPRSAAAVRAQRAARSRSDRRQRLTPREEVRRGA